ncbi:MerR family transcriptional regulator [Lacrimispora brassicae]
MLSIGEFSKICEVSAKTLRYYAEIGLIVPSEVNPENGYRYYSIEQLKNMLFIDRLKSQHFSLEEIKSIMNADEADRGHMLYSFLNKKKHDLQDRVTSLEAALQLIHDDMSCLENGNSVMSYLDRIDVELVDVPAMNILYIRKVLSIEECSKGYVGFFSRLFEKIAVNNLTMTGMPMTMYHNPEFNPIRYDIEFAIPVKEFVTGTRDFKAGLCVKSVIKGGFSELTSVHAKQREWAESKGYDFIKPPFEIYRKSPENREERTSPEDSITEFYYPVKKK